MVAAIRTPPEPAWDDLIRQADQWVREILGQYARGKDLRWTPIPGPPPAIELTLTTETQSATGRLYLDELANRREVRWKALDLWGEVNDRQIKDEFRGLRQLLSEWREELEHAG